MTDQTSRQAAAAAEFDRAVFGGGQGPVEPPDVPTSSTEGVPDGYVEQVEEAATEVGGADQPPPEGQPFMSDQEAKQAEAEVLRQLEEGIPGIRNMSDQEQWAAVQLVLDHHRPQLAAADRVAQAAQTYAKAMGGAFARLPRSTRPYEEHARLLETLVDYHQARGH